VQFWTPVTGTRTENAICPCSELRETYADGRLRNWTYPEADNFLRATLAVNQVPSSGKIVIGQSHAYDSQKPLIKLEYQFNEKTQTGNIVAKVRMRPDEAESPVIIVASNVPLEKSFTYVINLNKAGLLSVYAADSAGSFWVTSGYLIHINIKLIEESPAGLLSPTFSVSTLT